MDPIDHLHDGQYEEAFTHDSLDSGQYNEQVFTHDSLDYGKKTRKCSFTHDSLNYGQYNEEVSVHT